jgi:hypothetical protein
MSMSESQSQQKWQPCYFGSTEGAVSALTAGNPAIMTASKLTQHNAIDIPDDDPAFEHRLNLQQTQTILGGSNRSDTSILEYKSDAEQTGGVNYQASPVVGYHQRVGAMTRTKSGTAGEIEVQALWRADDWQG